MSVSTCAGCGFPRPAGEPVCRACGFDTLTGTGPRAVGVVPLLGPGAGAAGAGPAADAGPAAGAPGLRWAVELMSDRAYFDRACFDRGQGGDPAAFPAGATARLVQLAGPRAVIGRRSRSRGQAPALDLSLPPRDPGVSRAHARLERHADGTVTVTDLGSANGTWLGPDADRLIRLDAEAPVPLAEADRVFVGAWTRLTVREH
ncbi:FHA domain-containing protein [Parafrankia elaeagni]|uniref:FHA domain-containing protein n=1 Tax=Parafrankia elaeagni TaxID=222534 RepID=UPI00036E672F|nr:FHA domain-containing protein [Parafrankia elaeagni]